MFKRQPGRSDATDASAYSRRSAVTDSLWAAQDRLRSGVPAAAHRFADVAVWPLERASYALRKKVIWPAEDRADRMGTPARVLASCFFVLLAVGVGVAGLVWAAPDGPHKDAGTAPVAASSAPLAVAKATPEKIAEPTLQGATPVFKPSKEEVAAEVDPAKAIVKSSPADEAPSSSSATSTAAAEPATAASSSSARPATVDGPPAGPQAISVAGDFAGAFVLYETGDSDSDVREVLGKTATPALAKALLHRPPRLPANVKVPKAKVVNVVPAPSRDGIYPVSVSLLRVGLTSELRLEMEKRKGEGWRVTNVLG
ncbi:MAG TPA: hypothetical protein VEW07_08725 [Solirubrobacterales bacterium]|nr:hypothetical protein [Solirubrobacterales bacterium]